MRVLSPSAVITLVVPTLAIIAACGGADSTTITPAVARVTVTGPSTTLNVGQFTNLSAAAYGATGAPISGAGVAAWSSSAPSVASVDQAGKVSGVGAGSATITAAIANVKGSFTLAVIAPAAASKDTIFTVGISFSPNMRTVAPGAIVIFALGFDGIGHDVRFAATSGAPADIPVTTRQYIARVFSKAGSFSYICPTHPEMTGVITVQ
jgi:plastocyanin